MYDSVRWVIIEATRIIDAANEALANNDEELAKRIKEFQFKDLRPKAASDMNNIELASKLLGPYQRRNNKKDLY